MRLQLSEQAWAASKFSCCPTVHPACCLQAVYAFWQYDLCDVFIEVSKPAFSAADGSAHPALTAHAAREALWLSLDAGLRHGRFGLHREVLPPKSPEHAKLTERQGCAYVFCFPTRSSVCSPQLCHVTQVTAPVHAVRDGGALAAAAAAGRPGGAAVHHAGAVPPRGAVLAR